MAEIVRFAINAVCTRKDCTLLPDGKLYIASQCVVFL
jgi:hypothetical protein